jgi:hypothetical protein
MCRGGVIKEAPTSICVSCGAHRRLRSSYLIQLGAERSSRCSNEQIFISYRRKTSLQAAPLFFGERSRSAGRNRFLLYAAPILFGTGFARYLMPRAAPQRPKIGEDMVSSSAVRNRGAARSHRTPIRIAIIENDPVFRAGLARMLRRSKHLHVLANAVGALFPVQDSLVDMIVLDIDGISGNSIDKIVQRARFVRIRRCGGSPLTSATSPRPRWTSENARRPAARLA